MTQQPRLIPVDSVLGHAGAPLLDIRSQAEVEAGHLPGAAWLAATDPVATTLPSHMLPPPGESLVVAASSEAVALNAAKVLRARGWAADVLADGWQRHASATGRPRGRLWRPDEFLARCADQLPAPSHGPVLDLGGGNGRNAVYLAQRGYEVLLIDHLEDALDLARHRAAHHGVQLTLQRGDLRDAQALPAGPFAIVLMIRFLERALFDQLKSIVRPGGSLVLRTFATEGARRGHEIRKTEARQLLSTPPWRLEHGPRIVRVQEGSRQRDLLEARWTRGEDQSS